jgi:hypothetical protein
LADAAGFFFAGAEPHAAEDGDLPRLNRPAAPLGMALLRLHSDFAQELAEYVGTEMKRAATTYDPHQCALKEPSAKSAFCTRQRSVIGGV